MLRLRKRCRNLSLCCEAILSDSMERPLGIKIAVVLEILILLLMVFSFLIVNEGLEKIKSLQPKLPEFEEDAYFGLSAPQDNDIIYDTMNFMKYVMLFVGILHIIPAYLIWKGNNIGKYIVLIFAVIDILTVGISILLSIPIIYFVWFDKKTKEYFNAARQY